MQAEPVSAFDEVSEVAPRLEKVASALRAPRDVTWLVELAGRVGCGPGALVLDAGGYAGHWASCIDQRYQSRTVVCDLAPAAAAQAVRAGRRAVVGNVMALPFPAQRFDVVWCRDMLSMVHDPRRTLTELRRVLKAGGGMVLYAAFPTPRLEPLERKELFADLEAPRWWNDGAQLIRRILDDTGFETVAETRTSPEHTQANLERRGDLIDDWVMLARLEREPDRFREAVGDVWYRRFRAWNRWSIYLLLGKLETIAWALRARP